jgi:O-antigen/teichoic acid export membrane protein
VEELPTKQKMSAIPYQRYRQIVSGSHLRRRLSHGIFWSVCGLAISRLFVLTSNIFLARILNKTGYGELGIIQSTVAMVGVFAGFGLGTTATKHLAELRVSDPERAGRILTLSSLVAYGSATVMSSALFVFAPWIAKYSLNAPNLTGALRYGVLVLFFSTINGTQTGTLAGFESFKVSAKINLATGILSFPMLVAGALWWGVAGAIVAQGVNLTFCWALNWLAVRREANRFGIRYSFCGALLEKSILWRFSVPAALGGILVGPINWATSAMLVNQPDGYGELAVYNAANQWFNAILFLPSAIGAVMLPILSEQFGRNDSRSSIKTLRLSIFINLLIASPVVAFGCLFSPAIMALYGKGFTGGAKTLVVTLITACLFVVNTPIGNFITASGRMWIGFLTNLCWAVTFLGISILLTRHGATGLSLSRLSAYTALTMLQLMIVCNKGVTIGRAS